MGCLLLLSAQRKSPAPLLTPDQQRLKWSRHRAAEAILLDEFDTVVAELDRAKQDPLLPDQVRVLCDDYRKLIQRLAGFSAQELIPPDVSRKLARIDLGAPK